MNLIRLKLNYCGLQKKISKKQYFILNYFLSIVYRIITIFTKDQSRLSVKLNQAFEISIALNFSVGVAVEIG